MSSSKKIDVNSDFAAGVDLSALYPLKARYTPCTYMYGGGESSTREKVRGATVHKAGSKIPT